MITPDMFVYAPSFIISVQCILLIYLFLLVYLIRFILFDSTFISTIQLFRSFIDVH